MASNPPSRVKTRSPVNQTAKSQPAAPVRLKTVVRRLPPNLPEAVFWQSVEQWVSEESVSWKVFYQGKLRKKLNKENIPSRAYILFKSEESLASFSRGYDGHLFRDKQGNESQAVVEFAPNQKVPPEKKKADSRHATILQDDDYLSFVAALQNPQPKAVEVDVEALLSSTQPHEEPKTTPLLAALREQKSSAYEKKLAASEASKSHPRKVAAAVAAPAPVQNPGGEDAAQPAAKKSRRGRAMRNAKANPAPVPSQQPQGKPGSGIQGRPTPNPVGASGPVAPPPATASTSREPVSQGVEEPSQRRNRPMLGLQSRHLKAALTEAGVAVSPASPSALVSSPAPNVGRSTAGSSRGAAASGGGEKQEGNGVKDGAAKSTGGGRGGGRERTRTRPPPAGSGPPAVGLGQTPRILSRQETSTAVPNPNEPPARERVAAGPPEPGAGRGRTRRGRGTS